MNAAAYRRQHNRQPGECTYCGKPVPKGRRSWCSQRCVDRYRERFDWTYIRRKVEKRDRGVCRLCGADTHRIAALLRRLGREGLDASMHAIKFYAILCGYGATAFRVHTGYTYAAGGMVLAHHVQVTRDLWEADHIKPRHRGGSDHPRNLRTLCIPCHKAVTAWQAAERAAKRKPKRAKPKGSANDLP